MSMFDYDARPVMPGVVLVGTRTSRGAYAIRDFLSRNGYPFEWVDVDRADVVAAVLAGAGVEPSALPLCILPDGSRLPCATVEQVAAGLGMVAAPSRSEYDLMIVGAGPAGLAAAVNAASEGLSTVVVEAVAPGGQAGTTSVIENLLGFPNGISGSELATRAVVQARRFGAELLLARPLVGVSADGPGYVAELSDGTLIRGGRCCLPAVSSGAAWTCPGSMTCSARGCTTGQGRARRWRVQTPVLSWSAAETPRARRSSGSPGTRSRSRCWSAAMISARRCRSTSSIR
jgi:thioredoxin reductase (NADPH)